MLSERQKKLYRNKWITTLAQLLLLAINCAVFVRLARPWIGLPGIGHSVFALVVVTITLHRVLVVANRSRTSSADLHGEPYRLRIDENVSNQIGLLHSFFSGRIGYRDQERLVPGSVA